MKTSEYIYALNNMSMYVSLSFVAVTFHSLSAEFMHE